MTKRLRDSVRASRSVHLRHLPPSSPFRSTTLVASALGAVSAIVGLALARVWALAPGGTIVLVAAALFVVAVIVLGQNPAAAVTLGAVMLLFYVPLSYYTDLLIYRRRQRKKAAG